MAERRCIKVGSRKSQLAMIQTEFVVGKLQVLHPDFTFEIVSMSTLGDQVLDRALSKIGEKSLFTKELEIALEQNVVDFVVHSLKDLPTNLPDGMVIAAILERDDPRDAVVFHSNCPHKRLSDLPADSVIGTSSLRRVAQLKRNFPQLKFESIRGNLNTRLRKLDEADQYTAIVLAVAGLERMGWYGRIDQILEPETECMYAISQGALGVECRADDEGMIDILSALSHTDTLLRCLTERAFLKTLEGGCTVPIAVHTEIVSTDNERHLHITGGVFSLDGEKAVTSSSQAKLDADTEHNASYTDHYAAIVAPNVRKDCAEAAQHLGEMLAQTLLTMGAKPVLDRAKEENRIEQELIQNDAQSKISPNWPSANIQ